MNFTIPGLQPFLTAFLFALAIFHLNGSDGRGGALGYAFSCPLLFSGHRRRLVFAPLYFRRFSGTVLSKSPIQPLHRFGLPAGSHEPTLQKHAAKHLFDWPYSAVVLSDFAVYGASQVPGRHPWLL